MTRTYTNGRLTGLNLGADYGVSYSYDTYGWFETLTSQVAGTRTQTYTYGYLQNSDLLESLTTSHGLTVMRSYEPNRDVLTQVQNQFGTDTISQYDYTNDELAQRTSITTSGLAFETAPEPVVEPGTTDYTTNNLNQYTSLQFSVSSIQLSYDLDGNLIEDNIHHFTYDAENRLTSVTPITPMTGSTKVEFGYDYMSRRVEKQVSTYDGSSWVLETAKSFTYDGWNLIQEQTTGGTATTDYYVWGLDLSGSLQGTGGIGGLLSKTNSLTSTTYLYTFDANGNVGQLVDASDGSIAAHYEYDPFGNLVVITGSEYDNNVFRFSTKYYDVETGLYDYGYRYYSAELGRWVNRDPIEEDGGLNLYGFVENNPVNMFDNIGLYGYPFTYDPINPPWYEPKPGPPFLKDAIEEAIDTHLGNPFDNSGGVSCEWRAAIGMGAVYIPPFAAGGFMMEVESQCCRGKRVRGKYVVIPGMVGVAVNVWGWPFEYLFMTAKLLGPSPPSKHDPVGWFSYGSSGASAYLGGASAAIMITGELVGHSVGGVAGLDKGVTIGETFFGYTLAGANVEEVDCCDESNSKPIRTPFGDF